MPSIKQNLAGQALPDFRNFGVMLRILLGVNLLALVAALVQARGVGEWIKCFVDIAAWVQPLLLFSLLLLALLGPALQRMTAWVARFLIVATVAVASAQLAEFWSSLRIEESAGEGVLRAALLGACIAGSMLFYFALRARAFSPALTEARLQALTARIRPHFLFNSLNAVLSLIRAEPRRAEAALEELAELFRVLMRDHRDLLPLADEIALCRQYLDLEKLRLGDRLNVDWDVGDVPMDLDVPPLMLQPLLENAVYHGIEPSGETGTLRIRIARQSDELHIDLANPCRGEGAPGGSHMALSNIRERLALYYDLEARLETGEAVLDSGAREYRVHIVLPCRRTIL